MTQITNAELTRIIRTEEDRRRGFLFAFVAATRNDREVPFQIGVAILGEAGYALPKVPMLHLSYESASAMAERLNNLHGLSERASIAIVADTMHRSRMAQEEREGLVVLKMTKEEAQEVRTILDDFGHVSDIAERIDDAMSA